MLGPARKVTMTASALVLAVGLGGCTTAADFSYSEYQLGPGFQTERTYGSRLYGDTERGLGSESCRVVARREVDPFGRVSVREETVCNEF